MKLAHLQQQITELTNSKDLEWSTGSFSKRMVLLHSSISGAANACKGDNSSACTSDLAILVIQIVAFPAMFPSWGDIWESQGLVDFITKDVYCDLWDCLYKLHHLAAGLVGGRSDIILLIKMLQVVSTAAKQYNIDLVKAIEEQMDIYWQTV